MKHKRPARQSIPKSRIKDSAEPVSLPGSPDDALVLSETKPSALSGPVLWIMIGFSGFACLVYQILWMRQVGLLFGNTSHAAALTLAVFFCGLSLGGWYWGRRCRSLGSPLRVYAWLEAGIAVAGMAIVLAPALVRHVYPMLYQQDGKGLALLAFKVAWTLLMVFPPAFLMGGTLPVLGQAVIRKRNSFGSTTARIYAVNTMGAAMGAFATGFLLIWLVGFRMTCATAMVVSMVSAVLAWRLSLLDYFQFTAADALEDDDSKVIQRGKKSRSPDPSTDGQPLLPRAVIAGLAFVSGFNLLALEVVWTRMLAQVHENSVYSFATVLIVVLICLSLGAWLASRLARSKVPSAQVLVWLIALGGASLGLTPLIYHGLTDGVTMLKTDFTFATYVLRLFATAFAAIGPTCLLLGAVFPFLMKGEERFLTHAGESIGILSAINTLGAILGSLAAGFLLLEWFGLWHAIQLISAIYLLAAVVIPAGWSQGVIIARVSAVVALLLLLTVLNPSKLAVPSRTDAMGAKEELVEKWEGSDCTVTVVRNTHDNVSIKINSNYSLGSSAAYGPQAFQARIPLFAFSDTESVFFLGMGTGITAGEALNRDDFPKIGKVVACELSPNVVAASQKYFTGRADGFDLTNGLYQDPRARVLTEDGRNHLLANRETYSMINADLFLPYRRGTGNLYSRDHFTIVRERLKPGGVFIQWLPLYQMTEREFGTIAHTMISVFPQVSLWRGNFQPGAEIAALVGHADLTPLPASTVDAESDKRQAVDGATHLDIQRLMLPINEQTVLLFYGGNLSRAADMFGKYPLNTDDKPVIEFGTPRSLHQPSDSGKPHFLEARFSDLVDKVQKRTPPETDPLLALRTPTSRKLPIAGSAFHRASIASVHGDTDTWVKEWEAFLSQWMNTEPMIDN
jgi:spermidine synthase